MVGLEIVGREETKHDPVRAKRLDEASAEGKALLDSVSGLGGVDDADSQCVEPRL